MCEQNLERGSIKYPERYKQLISYAGLERHRHITPTDIDGLIDYNGNAFFYMECKHEDRYFDTGLDIGQRKAIENIVNSHIKAGHKAIAIIFIHDNYSNEIIEAKYKTVVEYYWNKIWYKPKETRNVISMIEVFEKYCKDNNVII